MEKGAIFFVGFLIGVFVLLVLGIAMSVTFLDGKRSQCLVEHGVTECRIIPKHFVPVLEADHV